MKFMHLKNNNWIIFAVIAPTWVASSSVVLSSIDGIVYAQVAKELSQKPLWEWSSLSWHGNPFYEHPHFLIWMIAIFFKFFGISTFVAVLPILLLSSLTIACFYFIIKEFFSDEKSTLIFFTIILLDFVFIKYSRRIMLEVPLMFFFSLSLLFIARYAKNPSLKTNAIFLGGSVFGSIMSKGIVGLMPLGVGFLYFMFSSDSNWKVKIKNCARWLSIALATTIPLLVIVDLWHYFVTGESFWKNYIFKQVLYSIKGRGGDGFWPILFYLKIYLSRYIPWGWIATISPLIFFSMKTTPIYIRKPFYLGMLYLLCMFAGFSISKHSAPWYINIHFLGTWLLAGSCIVLFKEKLRTLYLKRAILSLTTITLVTSSFFPSLFSKGNNRFIENYFIEISRYKHLTKGKEVADCINLDPWKGSFFISFYLDAKKVTCKKRNSHFILLKSEQIVKRKQPHTILYSRGNTHFVRNL